MIFDKFRILNTHHRKSQTLFVYDNFLYLSVSAFSFVLLLLLLLVCLLFGRSDYYDDDDVDDDDDE